ncbi:MAG: hypothetical protein NC048_09465 [Bacteroides sp.]|nr:hypothetical protein [Ruminococcus flavefaciens]MCM1555704.1 hypothetical protein [Bacteroides sp.]
MKKEVCKQERSNEDSSAQKRISFEEDVAVYCKRLYNFLYGLCRDEELSKDLLQDTMIRAQYHFLQGSYNEKGLVWCWLRTIAQNILYKHYREQNRIRLKFAEERQQICDNLGWSSAYVEPAVVEMELPPRISRKQTKDILGDNMALIRTHFRFFKLSPGERNLIYERHINRKSFKELACMSGDALSTVMSRYYTAMKKMQRQIIDWEAKGLFLQELNPQRLREFKHSEIEAERLLFKEKLKKYPLPGRPRKELEN